MKARLATVMFFSALVFICNAAPASESPDPQPKAENTKPCFQCNGTGMSKCTAPTCVNGKVDCPGPCMSLSKGVWKHRDVPGHGTNDLWQDFLTADRKRTYRWSQGHVGEAIQMQNGIPVNIGTCTVCGGTTKVQCKVCQGKGTIACQMCDGKKSVPESWSAFDNPKMKNRPNRFTLKDGSVVVGYKKMAAGRTIIIRTEKGEEKLEASNIVSEEKQPTQK